MRRRLSLFASLALIVLSGASGVSVNAQAAKPAVVTIAHFNDVYEIGS